MDGVVVFVPSIYTQRRGRGRVRKITAQVHRIRQGRVVKIKLCRGDMVLLQGTARITRPVEEEDRSIPLYLSGTLDLQALATAEIHVSVDGCRVPCHLIRDNSDGIDSSGMDIPDQPGVPCLHLIHHNMPGRMVKDMKGYLERRDKVSRQSRGTRRRADEKACQYAESIVSGMLIIPDSCKRKDELLRLAQQIRPPNNRDNTASDNDDSDDGDDDDDDYGSSDDDGGRDNGSDHGDFTGVCDSHEDSSDHHHCQQEQQQSCLDLHQHSYDEHYREVLRPCSPASSDGMAGSPLRLQHGMESQGQSQQHLSSDEQSLLDDEEDSRVRYNCSRRSSRSLHMLWSTVLPPAKDPLLEMGLLDFIFHEDVHKSTQEHLNGLTLDMLPSKDQAIQDGLLFTKEMQAKPTDIFVTGIVPWGGQDKEGQADDGEDSLDDDDDEPPAKRHCP